MTQISSNIYHIGVDDDNLDLFEGQYPLTSGISYNSYLIDGGTIAIVDAVDTRRTTEWLARLSDALGTRVPDYLIVQQYGRPLGEHPRRDGALPGHEDRSHG